MHKVSQDSESAFAPASLFYQQSYADRKIQAGTTGSFNKQEHRVCGLMHWSRAIKDRLSSLTTQRRLDLIFNHSILSA
jgi:hypothetical protein